MVKNNTFNGCTNRKTVTYKAPQMNNIHTEGGGFSPRKCSCEGFALQIIPNHGQRWRGTKVPNECGHHLWLVPGSFWKVAWGNPALSEWPSISDSAATACVTNSETNARINCGARKTQRLPAIQKWNVQGLAKYFLLNCVIPSPVAKVSQEVGYFSNHSRPSPVDAFRILPS